MRIGVTLPSGGEAEIAVAAESVGVPFVHVAAAAGTESAIAATVVAATSTVRVIVGVNVGDEHPVTLAEEIAVLDNLSNGRVGVIAELGALDPDAAAEDVALLRASWSGRAIAHRGKRWQVPAGLAGHVAPAAVMVTPPPAQLEVPLWVAGDAAGASPVAVAARRGEHPRGGRRLGAGGPGAATLTGDLDADRQRSSSGRRPARRTCCAPSTARRRSRRSPAGWCRRSRWSVSPGGHRDAAAGAVATVRRRRRLISRGPRPVPARR